MSGWNVLIDDVLPARHQWATAPRQVSIALTNACDLSCSYCFAPKTRAILDYPRITSWLRELDMHGTVGIGFGGGEPTLYPRFAELCTYATKHTSLAVTFTTHGHHLDDHLLGKLEGNVNFVRISMDGVGKTYERLRRRPFAALIQRLKAVGQITRFGINYVVNSETLRDLDHAVQLAEEVAASELLLLPERPMNGGFGITRDIMSKLREWILSYRGTIPLSISEGNSDGIPISDPFATESPLQRYAHIDASGTLKLTSFEKTGVTIEKNIMPAFSQLRHLAA